MKLLAYFDEFKNAVNNYINGLETGKENLQKLEDSLNGRLEPTWAEL